MSEIFFSDPKLNAMREAAVAGDWGRMFSIAPRGCVGPAGPTMADGSRGACGDDPTIPLNSAEGSAAYYYWLQNNPARKNITIQDLRITKDASGRIVKVPLTPDEIRNFFENYQWARHDWKCTPGQVEEYIHDAMNGRAIYPLAQCAQSSASRRRKIAKKVAAGAVAITGAIFLGPAIAGAAGKVGGAVGGALGKIGVGGAGKVLSKINDARTLKAILNGEMPPPPIDISGQAFRDWAFDTAQGELVEAYQRQLTKDEENALKAEIAEMQRQMAAATPRGTPMSPAPGLSPAIQSTMLQSKKDSELLSKVALIGIPIAMALILKG